MKFEEGIELLNTVQKTDIQFSGLLLILGTIVIVLLLIMVIFASDVSEDIMRSFLLILICCMVGIFACFFFPTEINTIFHQVSISDEVNLMKFQDQYDVVKKEGKIYTIKMKE